MRNTSTLKKGLNPTLSASTAEPTWSRTDVQNTPIGENRLGLTHFAFALDSKEEVLKLTEKLRSAGYTISGEPRTSGDGYFESVVLDPDGNRVECVFKAG